MIVPIRIAGKSGFLHRAYTTVAETCSFSAACLTVRMFIVLTPLNFVGASDVLAVGRAGVFMSH